jgi:hypothetical protein
MRNTLIGLMMGFGMVAATIPAQAHHAFAAEFDGTKPVTLKGTVTKVEWINPHAWIHVDVKGADGKVVDWMIECGSPNVLFRRGLTKDSIKAGEEVLVEGFMAKDGSNRANGKEVMLPGGEKRFLGSSSASGNDGNDKDK